MPWLKRDGKFQEGPLCVSDSGPSRDFQRVSDSALATALPPSPNMKPCIQAKETKPLRLSSATWRTSLTSAKS
eukprot:1937439-Pyramimonas_sp.AAC.1